MVVMACFAVFRLDERSLVLLPGNLLVAGGLLIGAVIVALERPFSLVIGLCSAALTAVMGLVAVSTGAASARYLRLPGYPFIWVVIGLYIAFRLVIHHQHQARLRQAEVAKTDEG